MHGPATRRCSTQWFLSPLFVLSKAQKRKRADGGQRVEIPRNLPCHRSSHRGFFTNPAIHRGGGANPQPHGRRLCPLSPAGRRHPRLICCRSPPRIAPMLNKGFGLSISLHFWLGSVCCVIVFGVAVAAFLSDDLRARLPPADSDQKIVILMKMVKQDNRHFLSAKLSEGIGSELLNGDSSSISCLVKIYDMPESDLKLNDVFEFIGIYTFDRELAVYKDDSDDPLAHLPPSKVEYEFEYYKLEMVADVQLLVLSEAKSNILLADLVLPFCPKCIVTMHPASEELQAWRWYLAKFVKWLTMAELMSANRVP
ncbi:hypothetical protein Cni_G08726 [Canna indica]|uniref:Uncharacterized protein n=1 Tax=Canna indica TaxID=4628 RepID=A0AAQ3Q8Y8_9LILI|nr:hypothetical protein Cni_G08726 [Canna indica]